MIFFLFYFHLIKRNDILIYIKKLLPNLNIVLLTGKIKVSEKKKIYVSLKDGNIDITIDQDKEGIKYIVKSGDTLYQIATSYGVSVDNIKKANNLTSNILSIGQELIIPVDDTIVEEVDPPTAAGINYVVKSGDNLYSIANKYGVSVDDIKNTNNLLSNTLQIGQILKIPGTSNYATYTVKSGDSLWKIANEYGTTVNELKTINNLEGTLLAIGQELLIPTK